MTGSRTTSAAFDPLMSASGKSRPRPAFRTSLPYPQQQTFHIRTLRELTPRSCLVRRAYPSHLTGAGDRGGPERRRVFARSESHRPASPTVGFVIGGLVFSIQFHTPRGGIESTDGHPTAAPAMES